MRAPSSARLFPSLCRKARTQKPLSKKFSPGSMTPKAEDVISINLDGKSSVADFMVIASGRSDRHVGAIADQVRRKLRMAVRVTCKSRVRKPAIGCCSTQATSSSTCFAQKCASSITSKRCGRPSDRLTTRRTSRAVPPGNVGPSLAVSPPGPFHGAARKRLTCAYPLLPLAVSNPDPSANSSSAINRALMASADRSGLDQPSCSRLQKSRAGSTAVRKSEEAAAIIDKCGDSALLIALDERGKNLTSSDLATTMGEWRDGGVSEVCFAIGGADGHGDTVTSAARMTLSLGKLTLPHGLARHCGDGAALSRWHDSGRPSLSPCMMPIAHNGVFQLRAANQIQHRRR